MGLDYLIHHRCFQMPNWDIFGFSSQIWHLSGYILTRVLKKVDMYIKARVARHQRRTNSHKLLLVTI